MNIDNLLIYLLNNIKPNVMLHAKILFAPVIQFSMYIFETQTPTMRKLFTLFFVCCFSIKFCANHLVSCGGEVDI